MRIKMGRNTRMSKTWKINPSQIDDVVSEVNSNPDAEIETCKSEYETLRARIDGKLMIIYSSGKVVYHESKAIEEILSKYGHATSAPSKKKELKPINMKMNEEQKEALIQHLSIIAESGETPGEYEEAAFSLDEAKITIYTTGAVYSPHGHQSFEEAIIKTIEKYPIYPQYGIIIGQDEVGKGELFGPMVVSSVAVTQEQAVALQFTGAKDSKELSPDRIQELAEEVKAKSIARRTVSIQARRFNELFEQLKKEDKTLNDLLAWAHARVLEDVLLDLDEAGKQDSNILVIIDEFGRVSADKRLKKLVDERGFDLIQTPRAESLSVSVAAASILAKAQRNVEMKNLHKLVELPIDRRNLDVILRHPKAPEIVRYSYIEKSVPELPEPNTIQGIAADAFLDQLVIQSRLETYYIDFKMEFPKNSTDIGKIVAGMANCDGGDLYFGILQDSKQDIIEITGVDAPQKIEERTSGVASNCEPVPKVDFTLFIRTDGRKVLRACVPMSSELVYFEARYYKRVSSGAGPMTKYEIDNWPDSCRRTA
jgi:ribonuclease HIII